MCCVLYCALTPTPLFQPLPLKLYFSRELFNRYSVSPEPVDSASLHIHIQLAFTCGDVISQYHAGTPQQRFVVIQMYIETITRLHSHLILVAVCELGLRLSVENP